MCSSDLVYSSQKQISAGILCSWGEQHEGCAHHERGWIQSYQHGGRPGAVQRPAHKTAIEQIYNPQKGQEMSRVELIAPCHFGLESVLKKEILDLGYEIVQVEDGRITFAGDESAIARANIFIRTAGMQTWSRISARNRAGNALW